jgi:bifunctional UDP-N-acetylglucosamine pyrophosphorylase/glucosamine-1-phosphate N-acetyltransferase
VILAAGQGKRMHSSLPKPLHPLAGREMILHVVDALREAEVDRVIVVVGHGSELVRAKLPSDVEIVDQAEQLGTAHATLQARPLLGAAAIGADVIVCYGDCPLLTPSLFQELIQRRHDCGAAIALAVSLADDPRGYGRVIHDADGRVRAIVEEAAATDAERAERYINAGVYCFDGAWLWNNLANVPPARTGEYYLTDLVGMATHDGKVVQSIEAPLVVTSGVNDRRQLAVADRIVRDRIRDTLMLAGVTLVDPAATYVDCGVSVGPDTVLYPGTILEGHTIVGAGCRIGPHSHIVDSEIADDVVVTMSVVERAAVAVGARIGPFSHLRAGARIAAGVELGNYAEVKNASLGAETKMHHFSYVGDAEIGPGVNIGAGTITCNYDGETGLKSQTVVEAGASLGCDTLLVAPVRLGERALTGAGAVVTHDVEPEMLVMGLPARPVRKRRPTA